MMVFAVPLLLAVVLVSTQAENVLSNGSIGYEYFPGFGLYKFYPEPHIWSDAVQTCLEDGGQLGVLSSDDEAEIYNTLLLRHPETNGTTRDDYIFGGFVEYHDSRNFLTLEGVPISKSGYSKWGPGEPNNYMGWIEKCGSYSRNVELNDIPCSTKLAFICELKYTL